MKTAALILAAGHSSRMGQNKALMRFNPFFSFLDQLISEYALAGVKNIRIVCQSPAPGLHESIQLNHQPNIKYIINNHLDLGRGYSIFLGLQECIGNDWVFIQNIDNPFTSSQLIQHMLASVKIGYSLVPTIKQKKGHPILVDSSIIKTILRQDASKYYFKDIIAQYPQKLIAWNDDGILANINTPQEYQKWIQHRP